MVRAETQAAGITVAGFLAGVEPEAKRADAAVLDALFRRATGAEPELWGPGILGYGSYTTTYDSGREVTAMRAGFSPRKAKHAIYLMGGYCDPETGASHARAMARLGKHATGASCLYVNKLADIDLGVLEEMVRADWATMKRRYPE